MKTQSNGSAPWRALALLGIVLPLLVLAGCGGGSGGGAGGSGGGGGLPDSVSLTGTVFFGALTVGNETLTPFPTLPANGVPVPTNGGVAVQGAEVIAGGAGRQDYLQLTFNVPLDATTIFPGGGAASDGIVVFSNTIDLNGNTVSTPMAFAIDANGVIDGGNQLLADGAAPAVLRIYFDPDSDLTTPNALPEGSYTLRVNGSLRSFSGGAFCTLTECGGANPYLPELSFNVGPDTMPLAMRGGASGAGAANILQGDTSVPLNQEIELRFNKAVAFETLVGPGNLTTRDPFITIPIPFVSPSGTPTPPHNCQAVGANGQIFGIDIGNLFVGYDAPVDPVTMTPELPPSGLGVVVYMPDPILNPTLVRIRFVDATPTPAGNIPGSRAELNGVDDPTGQLTGTVQYQNYASNPSRLPIPSSDPALQGLTLAMPPLRVVPGSLPGYDPGQGLADLRSCSINVVVSSDQFAAPLGLGGCQTPTGGLRDRTSLGSGPNAFVFSPAVPDYWLRFTFEAGAPVARNPMPPDACFVGQQVGTPSVAVINGATTMSDLNGPGTNSQAPPWAGGQPIGQIQVMPTRLTGAPVGTPIDIEIGHWTATLTAQMPTGTNHIANPGRLANAPGIPDTQNQTTPGGLLTVVSGAPGPVQPWGNFVYVIDGDANAVKVFNGYDFSLITSLVGAGAQPAGLAISPDLEFLYVSDFLGNTVRRFFANPVGPVFHTLAGTTPLSGQGPKAISVQPGGEDVIVCNWGDNSFSLIDANTAQEVDRFADPGAVGPADVFITNRMSGPGLTNAYSAFVINQFSGNVTIYESDSAAVPSNGPTGTVKATFSGFVGPRGGCWNWQTYIGATTEPGCFIANGGAPRVDELTMENFTLDPPVGFPGPPGIRSYRIQKSYPSVGPLNGANPSDVSIENHSGLYDVTVNGVNNNKAMCDPAVGSGTPTFVLVSYPSAGIVGVWDYQSPSLRSSASVPGCDFLQSYYDQ